MASIALSIQEYNNNSECWATNRVIIREIDEHIYSMIIFISIWNYGEISFTVFILGPMFRAHHYAGKYVSL